jgi:hypothetical protein
MRYKTLFRLAVKFLGVCLIAIGLAELAQSVIQVLLSLLSTGVAWNPPFGRWIMLGMTLPKPAVYLLLGLHLFFHGQWLVNLAIPGNRIYCHECGYDLSHNRDWQCPECGTQVSNEQREAMVVGRLSVDETDWRAPARAAEACLLAGDLDGAREHVETLKGIHPRLRIIAELERRIQESS